MRFDIEILRRGCLALVDCLADHRRPCLVSDERLETALQAADLGLWEWDLTTGNIYADRNVLRFLGLGEQTQIVRIEEVTGDAGARKGIAPHSPQRRALPWARRAHAEICHRARHADGRWVWIETHSNVTERDAGGRALRMTGTHTPTSRRANRWSAHCRTRCVMQRCSRHRPCR
jgi:two-component system sensor histidine kinase/response regulator